MKRVLLKIAVCVMFLAFLGKPLLTLASDQGTLSGQIMTLSDNTNAYATTDESAEVVHSFNKGETVYVVGESDGWYQIFYKGEDLFIPSSSITSEAALEAQKQSEELAEEVNEELKAAEKKDVAEIEAYWRQRKSERNAMLWKIIIAILVVAIIAVSVVTGIQNAKADKEKT